jgi:hypothetical protein
MNFCLTYIHPSIILPQLLSLPSLNDFFKSLQNGEPYNNNLVFVIQSGKSLYCQKISCFPDFTCRGGVLVAGVVTGGHEGIGLMGLTYTKEIE